MANEKKEYKFVNAYERAYCLANGIPARVARVSFDDYTNEEPYTEGDGSIDLEDPGKMLPGELLAWFVGAYGGSGYIEMDGVIALQNIVEELESLSQEIRWGSMNERQGGRAAKSSHQLSCELDTQAQRLKILVKMHAQAMAFLHNENKSEERKEAEKKLAADAN